MGNLEDLEKQNTIDNIIENLKDKLNLEKNVNSESNSISNKGDSESLDLNKIMEALNNSGLINKDKNYQNNNNSNLPDLSGLNLDMSTIMKFQRIFSAFNKADPRKSLLSSLKPFLRQTRQKNVDTYINVIGILGALGSFSDKGK